MVREPVHSTFEYLIGGSPCGGTTFTSIMLTKLGSRARTRRFTLLGVRRG
jgi:hypothetical protein